LSSSGGGDIVVLKLLVATGVDLTAPVGAVGEGSSTTSNLTPTVYVSTADQSRAVGIASDSLQAGNPTTSDVGYAWNDATGETSGIAVNKASNTPTSASNVTLNFNGGGLGREWNWAAIEVLPAVVPFTAPRPLVLGQAVNRAATY
jgi:hypothetical protein